MPAEGNVIMSITVDLLKRLSRNQKAMKVPENQEMECEMEVGNRRQLIK